MYEYYQNGPLPTWIGWYLQHLPNWFHVVTAALPLAMELVLVWMAFLPRKFKIICFFIVTAWQVGVIATANYAFLNYLVQILAVLLLDDAFLQCLVPRRWRSHLDRKPLLTRISERDDVSNPSENLETKPRANLLASIRSALFAVALTWIFYATAVPLVLMFWRGARLPSAPVTALEPFRIANQYGLFAVMTPHRYEIEFQGSNDGEHWIAYPFRYKPQELRERIPRFMATEPYRASNGRGPSPK